jgi:chromosomal replication initiator protein
MADTERNRLLWETVLTTLKTNLSEATYKTWFKDTGIVRRDDGIVVIGTPNKMVKDWICEKYHHQILKVLRETDETIRNAEYTVSKLTTIKKATAAPDISTNEPKPQSLTLPIETIMVDKRDNLNPRYTLENFIVGPFNQIPHIAAKAILENPVLTYNPLFIYGQTGHGKTHLIQAIGNGFKHEYPHKKILYATSENFTVDYMNAIRTGRANQFKEKYRQYDVLIMDDIQFIADKEKTQEELFHVFNYMYDNNKQIIFSSDQHPNTMPGLTDRLRGRMSAGLVAEIPEPDFESRRAIIIGKLAQQKCTLPTENIDIIAKEVRGNIRDIEGVLNVVMCTSKIKSTPLTEQELRTLIAHNIRPQRSVSPEEVIRATAQFYEISETAIFEKTRKKDVVKPRQIVMYLMREDLHVSFPSIGERLGGRDHTTVIHSCEKIKEMLGRDTGIGEELEKIRGILRG